MICGFLNSSPHLGHIGSVRIFITVTVFIVQNCVVYCNELVAFRTYRPKDKVHLVVWYGLIFIWRGGTVGRASDVSFIGCGFKSCVGTIVQWPWASYYTSVPLSPCSITWYRQTTVMFWGREGERRSGDALATCHRLRAIPTYCQWKGDESPAYAVMVPFTSTELLTPMPVSILTDKDIRLLAQQHLNEKC